jgi:hypothetical protein
VAPHGDLVAHAYRAGTPAIAASGTAEWLTDSRIERMK